MSEHFTHDFVGMSCDKSGCDAELETPPLSTFGVERKAFTDAAVAAGWSIWVSRSRRTYCPEHKPASGHAMRRVDHG